MNDDADQHEADDSSVVIPLLTRFRGLTTPDHRLFAVAEFELEGGAIIRIPIASDAVASFNSALLAWISKTAKDTSRH